MLFFGLLLIGFAPSGDAAEEGYRLLELDGYKVKWGDRRLGVGAIVSYAFAGESLRFDDALNCGDLAPIDSLSGDAVSREVLTREAAAAFRVWERAAGLAFHEVGDVRDADIILGAQGRPRGRAYANVSYADGSVDGVRTIEQALVCLNPDHEWKVGFDGDEDVYDLRYTLVHEIGHAIGLDHPGRTGQVMAFRYTEDFDALQPGDVRGARLLYGAAEAEVELASGFDAGPSSDEQLVSRSLLLTRRIAGITFRAAGIGDFLGLGERAVERDACTDHSVHEHEEAGKL